MNRVEELLNILSLERIEPDLFRGQHARTERQRSFGGLVMAQALEAAYETVPDDREAHSLMGYFLRAGSTDAPIVSQVSNTRDGGSFSNRRVQARQHGETIFVMSSSFKTPEQGLEHEDAAPDVPPPDECPPLSQILARTTGQSAEKWEREWGVLDARWAGHDRQGPDSGGARMRVWLKTAGPVPDAPRIHQALLAYASDLTLLAVSTVPHLDEVRGRRSQIATVDHSMWFHRPIRVDRWMLYDQHSPSASNGLGFSLGRLYGDGVLGASTAQQGLIRYELGR